MNNPHQISPKTTFEDIRWPLVMGVILLLTVAIGSFEGYVAYNLKKENTRLRNDSTEQAETIKAQAKIINLNNASHIEPEKKHDVIFEPEDTE